MRARQVIAVANYRDKKLCNIINGDLTFWLQVYAVKILVVGCAILCQFWVVTEMKQTAKGPKKKNEGW